MNVQTETRSAERGAPLLVRALRANGVFSGLSGVILIIAAPALAPIAGIPWPTAITVTGFLLLPFGFALWRLAGRSDLQPALGQVAVILDVLWVAGSMALLLGGWLPLTIAGKWIIALLADVVGLFAVLQFLGLRRLAAK